VVRSSLPLVALLLSFALPSVQAQSPRGQARPSQLEKAVTAVLDAQRDAWNRGDIAGYMKGYARSKDTVFISGDNLTRGWQTVLERYQKAYDSREKMGMLTFSDLEVTALGKQAAVVIGRWRLRRAHDEPHGRFTLIMKRTGNGWKIIHDHTSAAP
jgi:ketosteroid isomerase-like protein